MFALSATQNKITWLNSRMKSAAQVYAANLNRHTQSELEMMEKESVVAKVTFFAINIHTGGTVENS